MFFRSKHKKEEEAKRKQLESNIPLITKILDELVANRTEFSHIKSSKVIEIIKEMQKFETGMPQIENQELLNLVLKEELFVHTKRNGGIITHMECFQVIRRVLFDTPDKTIDVSISDCTKLEVKGVS